MKVKRDCALACIHGSFCACSGEGSTEAGAPPPARSESLQTQGTVSWDWESLVDVHITSLLPLNDAPGADGVVEEGVSAQEAMDKAAGEWAKSLQVSPAARKQVRG